MFGVMPYALGMVLLPIAFGLAILALLVILRRERRQRESGLRVRRPLFVTVTLGVLGFLGVAYITVYVMSALTA